MACKSQLLSYTESLKFTSFLSGEAVLSKNWNKLLINNLTTGEFDLYEFPQETPLKTYSVPSTRRKIKQCAFLDNDELVVCGSDNGKVYLFEANTGDVVQELQQDSGTSFDYSSLSPSLSIPPDRTPIQAVTVRRSDWLPFTFFSSFRK